MDTTTSRPSRGDAGPAAPRTLRWRAAAATALFLAFFSGLLAVGFLAASSQDPPPGDAPGFGPAAAAAALPAPGEGTPPSCPAVSPISCSEIHAAVASRGRDATVPPATAFHP